MSTSPATPSNARKQATYASPMSAMPSVERIRSDSRMTHSSPVQPSPASMYGGTAVSHVSTPATPPEVEAVLKEAKRNYENLIARIENLKASPGNPNVGAASASSNDHSSPLSSKRGIRFQKAAESASPESGKFKALRESDWRKMQSPSLHRSKNQANDTDDVFTSPDGARQVIHGSDESEDEPPFNPRGDRAGEAISNDNAQALLPPNACVFVANLSQGQTDDQLEHHVSNAFSQFGTCWVKIRRDLNGMPFAFVQYETADDAQRAITQGRGMMINGRPCRTEVAKVNRSLYLSRVTGGPISEAEARDVLSRYGDIQKVWHCSQTESEIFRLPEGIWVMYAFFQDCRDAQAGFRDHPQYRLEQPPMADDFRAHLRTRQQQSVSPMRPGLSPGRMLASPMRRVTTDICSIFVGNLPANITQDQLFRMFDMHGPIQNIEIIRKPSANIFGVNAFAFIEYLNPENAAAAVQSTPQMYGNIRLRVERKESIEPSLRPSTFASSGGSPRGPYLADSHDHLAMLYQRGVYAGMTQAAQTQAIPPPVWAPFPYYQSYDPTQYGSFTVPAASTNDATAGAQPQSNGFAAQTMGHFQYPQVPASNTQQAAHTNYQWPPANTTADSTAGLSSSARHESH